MTLAKLQHTLLRASAGTGKTFQLSNRYLHLLQRGVTPPTILATTFTRKAAGEILERVLARLAQAADSPAGAHRLADELGIPGLDLPAARRMLQRLSADMHRLSISTLDAFFNRMAQSFRHELGIPPQPRLLGQDDPLVLQLRELAIDAMLSAAVQDDAQTLIALMRRLHHDQARRSVRDSIHRIVGSLYDIYRQAPHADLWTALPAAPGLLGETQLAEILDHFQNLLPELAQDKRLATAAGKLLHLAQARRWQDVLTHGLAVRVAADEPTYYDKPLPPALVDILRPLLAHAGAQTLERLRDYSRAVHDLMQRFDAHYTRLREAHRVLLFSDLPRKLARELPQREDLATEVYYRLDTRVAHLLLDEFQDTSLEQWTVLRPFAQEIVAQGEPESSGRSFFCVGDIKQAIYNWRGGCREIFGQVATDLQFTPADAQTMSLSRRSAPVVLDAVNQLFASLPDNPGLTAPMVPPAAAWANDFTIHEAHQTNLPGYVELRSSPADQAPERPETDDDDSEIDDTPTVAPDAHATCVARCVQELVQAHPGKSIGILVRRNQPGQAILSALRAAGVQASGEGGNPVTDDPAVNAILAALTLADHPADTIAAHHVANSPLGETLGFTAPTPAAAADVARAIRADLLADGYARTLTHWARLLAPACSPRSAQRLAQLVELADRYEPDLTLRPRHFVAFVQQTPVEEPSPAPVRVMTIHRSKGLEFDIVVLPELHAPLAQMKQQAVWCIRPAPTRPISAVLPATSRKLLPLSPLLQQAWEQAFIRQFQDDLCALYVGMTRARYALHLIVKPLRKTKTGLGTSGRCNGSPAALLRHALNVQIDHEPHEGDAVLFTAGQPDWSQRLEPSPTPVMPPPAPAPPAPIFAPNPAPAPHPRRNLPVVAPSTLEHAGLVRATDLLRLTPTGGQTFGTLIHACFAVVPWLDDLPPQGPDDDTLLAALQHQNPGPDFHADDLLATFRAWLKQPVVRAALRKPATEPDVALELWRERDFVCRLDDQLLRGRFDRVVLHRMGPRIQTVELIDFKTDRLGDDITPATLSDRYRPQMDAYRRVLSRMLDIPAAAVHASLLLPGANLRLEV